MAASVARKVSSPGYPTVKEALASKDAPLWREAILKEITELKERGTWILVPRPKKGKLLPFKNCTESEEETRTGQSISVRLAL